MSGLPSDRFWPKTAPPKDGAEISYRSGYAYGQLHDEYPQHWPFDRGWLAGFADGRLDRLSKNPHQ